MVDLATIMSFVIVSCLWASLSPLLAYPHYPLRS